jgi:type IV pilus assembly protein PilV
MSNTQGDQRGGAGQTGGLAMVEVLIVLFITSVALLGMAGLQVNTVKQTTTSTLQTVAMMLADDLIGRMSTNRPALMNGMTVTDAQYRKSPGQGFPAAAAACTNGAGCTPEQMAATDLAQWAQMINNSLPATDETQRDNTFVCLDSNSSDTTDCDGLGSTFLIQIGWSEQAMGSNTGVQTYRMVFQP